MKTLKNNHNICDNCFAQISLGQANATTYAFGLALCVHCSSSNDKFESVISVNMFLLRGASVRKNTAFAD